MSATQTPTIQQSTAISAGERLRQIQQRYATWCDPLSKKLHTWIEKNRQTLLNAAGEKIDKVAAFQMERLRWILKNQYDWHVLLKDPVMVRGGDVFEKSDLECMLKSGNPGRDLKPIETGDIQKQSFAKAMLGWLQTIPTSRPSLKPSPSSAASLVQRHFSIVREMQNIRLRYAMQRLRQEVIESQAMVRRTIKEVTSLRLQISAIIQQIVEEIASIQADVDLLDK